MRKRKFTLVELLIVIGIIAILAGILLPVINGAAKKADMTKAKAEITTLVNAIKQFEATYGHLPLPTEYSEEYAVDADEYTELIKVLQAETPDVNTRNTRFLDVVGNVSGEFTDPWGNNYIIHMDDNYDGKIEDAVITSGPSKTFPATLYYSIIIWSKGAKDSDDSINSIRNDNVYSFPVAWDKNNTQYNITR